MAGMCVGSVFHCSVDSSTFTEDVGIEGVVRCAERRRIISMSSAGSGFCASDCDPVFESRFVELLDGGGERSRFLRAVRRRWDFEADLQVVLSACD